ncbi:pentapeptide repeat-containing protein [Tichowtungia aerotolerans]|uniref:Potassium channel domain-containing protein n=1 Tax=Tichowtungia aerotolerans TaxID=2697043 RepID=A0A6P1MD75_9BACT|nr:pentapeptide repeat-containing protein [Tichowtungia aerotolerans]QHI69546.1 hypothetical protein GT409_08775 [Tichowtungia aerotolerans]
MANPEHLEILNQGVEAWNQWRDQNDLICPDLSGVDLNQAVPRNLSTWKNGAPLWDTEAECFTSYLDLSGINLQRANLQGSFMDVVNLKNANLIRANLSKASLDGACLAHANLRRADLSEAGLIKADLKCANLDRADLSGVCLMESGLHSASLSCANLQDAYLQGANLTGANLNGADLQRAFVQGASVIDVNMRGANFKDADLSMLHFDTSTGEYRGIHLEGCYGCERFRRQALHQAFIEEFRESARGMNKVVYWVWSTFVDCGRSPWKLMKWVFVIWLLFAELFFLLQTCWSESFDIKPLPETIWTMLYYSIVTLTTLGFGDVTPLTYPAMILVSMEVVLGYIILGCLISFLSSKMVPCG